MTLEILGISVLWTFLFGYILVGAIDFGAGFFNAYSLLTGQTAHFDEHYPALFIAGLGSDECFPRLLLRRDYRILPENGVLLRNDIARSGKHWDYFAGDSWLVLRVRNIRCTWP